MVCLEVTNFFFNFCLFWHIFINFFFIFFFLNFKKNLLSHTFLTFYTRKIHQQLLLNLFNNVFKPSVLNFILKKTHFFFFFLSFKFFFYFYMYTIAYIKIYKPITNFFKFFYQKQKNYLLSNFVFQNTFNTATAPLIAQTSKTFYFLLTFFLKFIIFKIKKKSVVLFKSITWKNQLNFFKLLTWFLKKYKYFQKKFNKFILSEFFSVILFFFISKDALFFSKWLKSTFEKLSFKSHKIFINFLTLFFNKNFYYFSSHFKLLGFVFQVCGKISLGGNSKKKKHLITIGNYSLNTLKTKIAFSNEHIWTHTGVLGLTIFLFYF